MRVFTYDRDFLWIDERTWITALMDRKTYIKRMAANKYGCRLDEIQISSPVNMEGKMCRVALRDGGPVPKTCLDETAYNVLKKA